MYRSVFLSGCLIFACLTVSKARVIQKRQSQFEITQLDFNSPTSLNLETLANLAENLLKRDQQTNQNRQTYDVIVHYQPYHPSPYQHFPQPHGPPDWYGRPPPPPHGGPHPPPPPPFGGPHPPPPPSFGGPHQHPPPFGGPPPHGGPPPFGGPPPQGGPPPFGGPPPQGGPPPFGGPPPRPPPNRGPPGWLLPNEMTGFRPSAYDFENRPPPGFMPSPYNENSSEGLQKYPNAQTNEKVDEDKKKISGYIDGDFPVILLDPDNEVRR